MPTTYVGCFNRRVGGSSPLSPSHLSAPPTLHYGRYPSRQYNALTHTHNQHTANRIQQICNRRRAFYVMQAGPAATVYLITGATRGIGYALTERLAARPSTIIYAGARDASRATQLHELAAQHGSHVRILQLRSESDDDHAAAAQRVKAEVGQGGRGGSQCGNSERQRNWAGRRHPDRPLETPLGNQHARTAASLPALPPTTNPLPQPQVIVISSITASTTAMETSPPQPVTGYSVTNCAINHIVRRIHYEQPWLTAFPLFPGSIETNVGAVGAKARGLARAPVELSDDIGPLMKMMDEATRESHGGRFWSSMDGKQLPW